MFSSVSVELKAFGLLLFSRGLSSFCISLGLYGFSLGPSVELTVQAFSLRFRLYSLQFTV